MNPCGFVLLPAYLGLYLGDERGVSGGRRPIGRAIVVSVTVTASFVLLFGLAGIIASLAASALTSVLPWIGAAVGFGLILLGGRLRGADQGAEQRGADPAPAGRRGDVHGVLDDTLVCAPVRHR